MPFDARGAGNSEKYIPLFLPKNEHSDIKDTSYHANIDETFANYFLKNKAKNKCLKVLKCTCQSQKSIINYTSKAM